MEELWKEKERKAWSGLGQEVPEKYKEIQRAAHLQIVAHLKMQIRYDPLSVKLNNCFLLASRLRSNSLNEFIGAGPFSGWIFYSSHFKGWELGSGNKLGFQFHIPELAMESWASCFTSFNFCFPNCKREMITYHLLTGPWWAIHEIMHAKLVEDACYPISNQVTKTKTRHANISLLLPPQETA